MKNATDTAPRLSDAELDRLAVENQGLGGTFAQGLRAGGNTAMSQLNTLAGTGMEALGLDGTGRHKAAREYAQDAQTAAAGLTPFAGVHDLSSGARWAAGTLGQVVPTAGAAIGAGMLTGGGALPALAAGTAATLPMELGGQLQRQEADPVALAHTPGERLAGALPGALGASVAQNVVPAGVAGRLMGKAGAATGKQILGRALADIPANAAASGLAEAARQGSDNLVNPNAGYNSEAIKEASLEGGAVGGLFGALGAAGHAAGAAGPGAKSLIGRGLDAAAAKGESLLGRAKEAAGEAKKQGIALGTQAKDAVTDAAGGIDLKGMADNAVPAAKHTLSAATDKVIDTLGRAKDAGQDMLKNMAAGEEFANAKKFVGAQGEKLKDLIRQDEDGAIAKAKEWGTKLYEEHTDPETRQKISDALGNLGDRASRTAIAGMQQTKEIAAKVASKVQKFYDATMAKADAMDAAGTKKSEDYSGVDKAIADNVAPYLQQRAPELLQGRNLERLAPALRRTVADMLGGKELSSDRLLDLIDVAGEHTANILDRVRSAMKVDDPKQLSNFFDSARRLMEVEQGHTKLTDVMDKSLVDGPGSVDRQTLREVASGLVQWAGRMDKSPEARFHDQRLRQEMERYFGKKTDAVLAAVEKVLPKDESVLESGGRDTSKLAEETHGDDTQNAGMRVTDKPEGTKLRVYNDRLYLHPDKDKGTEGFDSPSKQAMARAQERYPNHQVRFLSAEELGADHPLVKERVTRLSAMHEAEGMKPDEAKAAAMAALKDYGTPGSEVSESHLTMTPDDIKALAFDTKGHSGGPAQLATGSTVPGAKNLDAIKMTRMMRARTVSEKDFSQQDNNGRRAFDARMFKEAVAAVQDHLGHSFDIPDKTVINEAGLTWGEAKGMDTAKKVNHSSEADVINEQAIPEAATGELQAQQKKAEAQLDTINARLTELAKLKEAVGRLSAEDYATSRALDRFRRDAEKRLDAIGRELDRRERGGDLDEGERDADPFGNTHETLGGRGEYKGVIKGKGLDVKMPYGTSTGDAEIRTNSDGTPRKQTVMGRRPPAQSSPSANKGNLRQAVRDEIAQATDQSLFGRAKREDGPNLKATLDKARDYFENPPKDYNNEQAQKLVDWAGKQEVRLKAELKKLDPNSARFDEVEGMMFDAGMLAEKGRQVIESENLADQMEGTPSAQAQWVDKLTKLSDFADVKGRIDKLTQPQLEALANHLEDHDPPAGNAGSMWRRAERYAADRAYNEEGLPDPKAVAAKKAAFLERAASGDEALIKEVGTSSDAKGLQRAAQALIDSDLRRKTIERDFDSVSSREEAISMVARIRAELAVAEKDRYPSEQTTTFIESAKQVIESAENAIAEYAEREREREREAAGDRAAALARQSESQAWEDQMRGIREAAAKRAEEPTLHKATEALIDSLTKGDTAVVAKKQVAELREHGKDTEANQVERFAATLAEGGTWTRENSAVSRALNAGGRLGAVMRALGDASVDPGRRAVAYAVEALAGDTPVTRHASMWGGLGGYQPIGAHGEVTVHPHAAGVEAITALHEGVHAATVRAMQDSPHLLAAAEALRAHVQTNVDGFAHEYGNLNAQEFVAEAMANPRIQRMLRATPPSEQVGSLLGKAKTAWDSFINLVAKALGVQPHESALGQMVELFGRIAERTADREKEEGSTKTLDAINARLSELVRDPDTAYGMLTRRYSLERAEPTHLYHGTRADESALVQPDGSLLLRPSKNFGGKTHGVSFTDDVESAKDYATRVKGGGPSGFSFSGAKILKIDRAALQGVEPEAMREWADYSGKDVVIPKGAYEIQHLAREKAYFRDSPLRDAFKEWVNDNYRGHERDEVFNDPHSAQETFLGEIIDSAPGDYTPEQVAEAKAVLRDQFGYKKYSMEAAQAGAPGPRDLGPAFEAIHRMLGDSVSVDLKADLPYAGDFKRLVDKQGGVEDVIRLSVHALNPLSTAYHESLHGFFAKLTDQHNGQIAGVLEKAASSPTAMLQLRKFLEHSPEALKQLNDPEERAAYMFQAWSQGRLKLGGEPATLFGRIAQFIRSALGIWSNDQRALHIMEYFQRGDFAKELGKVDAAERVHAALMEPGRNKVVEAAKRMTEPLRNLSETLAVAGHQRLRDTGIPALRELADHMKLAHTSTGEDVGYLPTSRAEHFARRNQMADALHGTSTEALTAAMEFMQRGNDAAALAHLSPEERVKARVAARSLRKVLDDAHAYMREAGVDVGDMGVGKDYFPRVWDTDFISKHKEQFLGMLDKYVQRGDLKGDPKDILRTLMASNGAEFTVQTGKPGMQNVKPRELKFIEGGDAAPFLNKNLYQTMDSYLAQATRRAEWARRFGDDNKGLKELMARAKAQGATERDMHTAEQYVMAMDGTLGDTISPEARRLQGNLMVYQNIRLLPMAVFSSAVDPLGVMVRGGSVRDAFETFKRGIKEIPRGFKDDPKVDPATELAATLGVIDNAALVHTLGTSFSQGMVGETGRTINDKFFRYNLMEQFNTSMRVGAMEAAMRFLARHADGKASQHSVRWLEELGLKPGEVQVKDGRALVTEADGLSPEQALKMRAAVNRWVDSAVLRPDAADKAIWMNDPHFALVAHLKQFVFSFHETILKRVMHEVREGNYTPALALASYVPTMIAADAVKGLIQGGGSQPQWKQDWDAGDYAWSGVERGGLLGVGQFGADMLKDVMHGGVGVGALAGPTIEQFADAVRTVGGREQFGDFTLHAMPANALYSGLVGGSPAEARVAD